MSSFAWPTSESGDVTSVNGLTGNIVLAAGTNITIVPSGQTLTINASGTATGTANTWAGFDGSGNLYSIPGWSSASTRTLSIISSGAGLAGLSATIASGNSGAGTDLAGGNLVLSSGASTGTGASNIQFEIPLAAGSTGSGINTPNVAATIDGNYQFGLNGTGSGTFKQRAAINTTSYSVTWPSTQASGTRLLENDGTGVLSWALAGSAGAAIGSPISGGTAGSVLFVDGSGNLGQDNPNFFWDTTNVRLGLGTTGPNGKLHISDGVVPATAVIAAGTLNNGYLNITRNGSNQNNFASTTGTVFRFIRADSDLATPSAVVSGDQILQMVMRGYDGSSNLSPAILTALVNGTVTVGSIPMDWVFATGTSTAVEAFRIKSTGVINVAAYSSAGIVHNDSSGNLSSSLIVNADVSPSAAIALTKLAATTVSRALVSDASGFITAATTTSTEIGFVSGVTSSIQTQLNAKGSGTVTSVALSVPASSIFGVTGSPVTTTGTLGLTTTGTSGGIPYFSSTSALSSSALLTANALILGGGSGAAPTALGSLGTTSTVLHGNAAGAPTFGAVSLTTDVSGALPIANGGTGQTAKTAAFDALQPMTTGGDIIYGGASGTGTRLANGTAGQYLKSTGGTTAPAWQSFTAPTIQVFNSTSTTAGRLFTVTSANATIGATYTNNSQTFTVLETISGSTRLFTSGVGAPLSSGTLTKSGGTGDATITFSASQTLATYTAPANVLHIHFQIIGGGGGGGGAGNSGGSDGGAGNPSAFGPSFSVALGGSGGVRGSSSSIGGAGGATSPASGLVGFSVSGGSGAPGAIENVGTSFYLDGGNGGGGFFGGGGAGGVGSNVPTSSPGNSGAGAGGGAVSATTTAGSGGGGGGGAGGYIEGDISSPAATLYYTIGTGGTAGSAGSIGTGSATSGAAAADGKLIVWEYYQ